MKRRAAPTTILLRCPHCRSAPMRRCRTNKGRQKGTFHVARKKAAQWNWGDVMQVVKEHRA